MGIYGMLFRLISILEWDPTWDPIRGFSNGDFGIAATRIRIRLQAIGGN